MDAVILEQSLRALIKIFDSSYTTSISDNDNAYYFQEIGGVETLEEIINSSESAIVLDLRDKLLRDYYNAEPMFTET